LTYSDLLGRRNEILKKRIEKFAVKSNKRGLSSQESHFYQHIIKEWHQNEMELNTVRRRQM
jgi:hypothetical protein